MKSLQQNFKDIEDEINFLKKKNNAIILSHFYQDEDIQDIADFIGDSLDLSKKAQKNAKKNIISDTINNNIPYRRPNWTIFV